MRISPTSFGNSLGSAGFERISVVLGAAFGSARVEGTCHAHLLSCEVFFRVVRRHAPVGVDLVSAVRGSAAELGMRDC